MLVLVWGELGIRVSYRSQPGQVMCLMSLVLGGAYSSQSAVLGPGLEGANFSISFCPGTTGDWDPCSGGHQ